LLADNAEVLTQSLCPTAYGLHNKVHYSLVVFQTKKARGGADQKECWRAGVTCDGRLAIEGPEAPYKQEAMMVLSEVISSRLARCIPRAWDEEAADQTGVEEHGDGARFAIEPGR